MVKEKFCIMLECTTDLNYFYGEWTIIPWDLQAIFTSPTSFFVNPFQFLLMF